VFSSCICFGCLRSLRQIGNCKIRSLLFFLLLFSIFNIFFYYYYYYYYYYLYLLPAYASTRSGPQHGFLTHYYYNSFGKILQVNESMVLELTNKMLSDTPDKNFLTCDVILTTSPGHRLLVHFMALQISDEDQSIDRYGQIFPSAISHCRRHLIYPFKPVLISCSFQIN